MSLADNPNIYKYETFITTGSKTNVNEYSNNLL